MRSDAEDHAAAAVRPFLEAMDAKYSGVKVDAPPSLCFKHPLSRDIKSRRDDYFRANKKRIQVGPHQMAREAFLLGLYTSTDSAYRGFTNHWRKHAQ